MLIPNLRCLRIDLTITAFHPATSKSGAVENGRYALERAKSVIANESLDGPIQLGVECDIQCYVDSETTNDLVVCHDETLARCAPEHAFANVPLSRLSQQQLLNVFYNAEKDRVVFLSDVLKGSVGILNLELKSYLKSNRPVILDVLTDHLLAHVKQNDAFVERVIVSSFDHELLAMFHERLPQFKTAVLVRRQHESLSGAANTFGKVRQLVPIFIQMWCDNFEYRVGFM